jgi:hypothetical protein
VFRYISPTTAAEIFGTPFPLHTSNLRTLNGEGDDAEGDILAEAVPLDIAHTVDEAQVDDLMLEIMENPPTLPVNPSGQDERIEEEVHALIPRAIPQKAARSPRT